MGSSSISSISSAERGVRSGSKIARKAFIPSSNQAASLLELKAAASRCQSPKQFHKLLERVRAIIPYRKLAAVWGQHATLHFIFNHGFPIDFLRWYFGSGALWTSPVFREWCRSKRAVLVCDVMGRLKADFDPELLKHYEQAGLYYSMCGGRTSKTHFAYFAAAMGSEREGRTYLELFGLILPFLIQASQQGYPRTLLTKRETAILQRRAMGEITKKIAAAEGISDRTVREHLHHIKKKLFTDDLVNAVVIAVRSGMLDET